MLRLDTVQVDVVVWNFVGPDTLKMQVLIRCQSVRAKLAMHYAFCQAISACTDGKKGVEVLALDELRMLRE